MDMPPELAGPVHHEEEDMQNSLIHAIEDADPYNVAKILAQRGNQFTIPQLQKYYRFTHIYEQKYQQEAQRFLNPSRMRDGFMMIFSCMLSFCLLYDSVEHLSTTFDSYEKIIPEIGFAVYCCGKGAIYMQNFAHNMTAEKHVENMEKIKELLEGLIRDRIP
jgi:hypothetical protein